MGAILRISLCAAILACLLVASAASRVSLGAEAAVGWGAAELVEVDDSGGVFDSLVAVDESGNAVAVWIQSASVWSNRYVVGIGWGLPTLVESDGASAYAPQVAVDESGNATAIWSQGYNFQTSVWSNRYVVGTGWGTAEVIETYDAGSAESPQLAVDGSGNAIAMWYQWDSSYAYTTVWYNRFLVGTGWGTAELVETIDAINAWSPQVAVNSSGDATAVWHQWNGTQVSVWSNRYVVGTGWGVPTLVGEGDTGFTDGAQVAVDSAGNAIAVWRKHDGTRYNVWSNRYVVGDGWGTAEVIETDDAGDAQYPQVAIDSAGNAIAVWQQNDGVCESVYSNRYAVGDGWGTAGLIESENWGDARDPHVAVDDSGNATAVWEQWDGTRYNVWSNRYVVPDTTPPALAIDSPSDGFTTETPVVMVSGTTEPGVDLMINGLMAAVESDGSFSCAISLIEGVNIIIATATDASDNSATVSVSVTYVNPVHELEEELEEAKDELDDVRDELNTTQNDLDAVEDELDATKDELNTTQVDLDAVEDELDATKEELNSTQADLNAVENELSATQDDLDATEEELSSTTDDLSNVKSQNTLLMAVLAAFAILAVVMSIMFLSLRKKMAELSIKSVEEDTPPPPQS